MSSNLPPGVTDRMIEEQAGAFDEPMPDDVEEALDRLKRLSDDGYALVCQETRYYPGEAKPTEWRATARINNLPFSSDPAPSAMEAVSGWVAEVKKAQVKASESVAMLAAYSRDRFDRDPNDPQDR